MSHSRFTQPILPGATLGVLGSGQLGRMFAISARRMGYRVHTLSPDDDTPTGQVADREIKADYMDIEAIRQFARDVSVVTFEFENVPAETAAAAEHFAPVRPAGQVLQTTQHRLREKNFLKAHGFPVTEFHAIGSEAQLSAALKKIGGPSILKTAGWGYDGKGQIKINDHTSPGDAWERLATTEAVLEKRVDFRCEVSVVAARNQDGDFAHFGVIENSHENHILDISVAPARISAKAWQEAIEITRGILDKLQVVGVLCVEFFLTKDDQLVVNELAPRPHNSGHLTFDACITSQFEQQVRAICKLPLGSTEYVRPASAMANLLGDVWKNGEPDWAAVCAMKDVKIHLYGKASPRVGRKMGHLTAMADDAATAIARVSAARHALMRGK